MHESFFEKLHAEGLIGRESLEKIRSDSSNKLLSVYWEIRTILYLGVLLLASGLGILVYKNIDTIGHQAVLIFIAVITAAGFYYCFKTKLPFSGAKVNAPNSFFDYVLLLACLCFIIFIGYWQYQYHVFGDRFGLATFIPMVVLFFSAYFFDHLIILALAISNLAAWVGIVVTPTAILKANDFNSPTIIITGMIFGTVLVLAGRFTGIKNFKPHFAFTYTNFGLHITFISCIAGLVHFDHVLILWFSALLGVAVYFYLEAKNKKSFYFLLMLTIYLYIGLSYVIIHSLINRMHAIAGREYLTYFYFIISGIAMIMFLMKMNKKIKTI
jgi:hypothetical protein